jgi:signal transduction histidine kinase/HAMP domain-containing protein
VKASSRLRHALSPRRSLAARLLFGFFLAFFIPGSLIVFVLVRRLSELKDNSVEQLTAVRSAQSTMQIKQDALFRAEWMDRRAAVAEEVGWSIASATAAALQFPDPVDVSPPQPDTEGHLWNPFPAEDTVAFIASSHAQDPQARRDFARTFLVAKLLRNARERRPAVRSVSVWTASGVMRMSPWLDIHDGIRQSNGALADFGFNQVARFPERRPAGGDSAIWFSGREGPRFTPDNRTVSLFLPVRDDGGVLIAAVAVDIDARRTVTESLEPGEMPGDVWFVVDGAGRPIFMTARAAELLSWLPAGGQTLGESADPERQKLARALLVSPRTVGNYRFGGAACRLASAKVRTTGWVFVEGLSGPALARLAAEAQEEIQPKSYSDLQHYTMLVFLYLAVAVLAVVVLLSRRISEPILSLVHAAEEIGQGRSVEVKGGGSRDELGRLAAAIGRMGRRVERRVETLRRLHALFRASYQATDLGEVLSRASEAIAAFTRAERVWFYLYDPDTNRLSAQWPGWNITEETTSQLVTSAEAPSIAGMVFKTGEPYVTNDLDRDPYVNRKLQSIVHASNALFCPLKEEDKTFGVAVATNRTGGFGHEEVDAMTSFADAASLLIKNARLYTTLSGTVEELRRASRLKDHFLQNVNHELRTPLTSIVGWTDLLEEGDVDEKTLRRGLKQMRQSARLLLALIDDLLDLARTDRGTLALDLRPVSLTEVAQRSIETVRLMAEARGVVLILAPPPEGAAIVRADPLRLQQILWNLLANAIKFTPRHGRVVVRIDREPERHLVSVEDDGVGIPEGELPHVFERFRQVDGSPTRRHPGMGIGLALARSLVELHGGTIWAESVVGHGSRFTFSLPITAADRRTSPGSLHRLEPGRPPEENDDADVDDEDAEAASGAADGNVGRAGEN